MVQFMKIFKTLSVAIWIFTSIPCFAQESSVAEKQQAAVRNAMAVLNQSSHSIGKKVFSEPQKAAEAGCLDSIKGIDLSVLKVDITSAWSSITKKMKDQIMNANCSAASDWAKEQASALETSMSGPLGTVSISISQGNSTDDWQSVKKEDVKLSDTELGSKVTTGTLGKVPQRSIPNVPQESMKTKGNAPVADKEKLESVLPDALKFKQLWTDPE